MNYLEDFDAFIGRIGNLYGKKNICSPFDIRRYAQGWLGDGIEPAYCLDQISLKLFGSSPSKLFVYSIRTGWYIRAPEERGICR